ncbi:hypothetical protein BU24DRAFT_424513 [Aaosphaeria arxii CBS 175.79]|uniref:CENP-V/GFA domain-containing protein n=1 Tax=Aaosphaeria arxii CBS 175.79 TaxID=1450172 RepID=A0A6A5XKX8_9PLEO|nr:uncharacterized protein BU24DRAFT_424513 [Aaosphaeria arxii CBS 175.79]KAF2013509.1 hypothetical protein BU24DRAFT_424513 [Aaosphaeria arxii CBS 175.79]
MPAADSSTASMEQSPSNPESVIYNGSCHCHRFEFNVINPSLTDPSTQVIDCNCSICTRNGHLLVHVPDANFSFSKGSQEELSKYTFGSHKIAHHFCPTCGTSCFAASIDPNFFYGIKAVNVRTFEGVDLKALNLKFMDGKNATIP